MLRVLIDIFTYLLAIYGATALIISIVNSIRQRVNNECSKVKLVLLVKDQEENIEGIIRNVFVGDVIRKFMSNERLTVMDMGSSDKTMEILEKLRDDYGQFELLEKNEKEKIFYHFEED